MNYIYDLFMSPTRVIKLFLLVLTIAVGHSSTGQEVPLSQRNYTIPLIKERGVIILSRTAISAQTKPGAQYLKQLVLNLEGTTDLKDISSVKVYCNTDSNYLSEDAALKAPLFNNTTSLFSGNTLTLNGNFRLSGTKNYIWIGVDVKEAAMVGNRIKIGIASITIDNMIVKNGLPLAFSYRIASAVRQSQQDNVHTSRIPGLATALNGDLLAVYDARYDSRRDLQGDIDIALSRSTDKGNTWLPIQKIIDMGTFNGLPEKFNGVSDPAILVDKKTGNIFVAGLWMHGVLDDKGKWTEGLTDTSSNWNHQWRNKGSQPGFDVSQTAQFLIVKSTDNGKTWSKPVNLTKMCKKEEWWLWAPAPEVALPWMTVHWYFQLREGTKPVKLFQLSLIVKMVVKPG
nr:BNR-repeat neuraminidase N-terminal domain-containing protein [Niabella hibiscisoli]